MSVVLGPPVWNHLAGFVNTISTKPFQRASKPELLGMGQGATFLLNYSANSTTSELKKLSCNWANNPYCVA
jgi:hypothetical protein